MALEDLLDTAWAMSHEDPQDEPDAPMDVQEDE